MFAYLYAECNPGTSPAASTFTITITPVNATGTRTREPKTHRITRPGWHPKGWEAINQLVAHEQAVNTQLGPPDAQLRVAPFAANTSSPVDDPIWVRDRVLKHAVKYPLVMTEASYQAWITWVSTWAPLPHGYTTNVPIYVFPSQLHKIVYQYPPIPTRIWMAMAQLMRWRTDPLYTPGMTGHERAHRFFTHLGMIAPEPCIRPAALVAPQPATPPKLAARTFAVLPTHKTIPTRVHLADPVHQHTDLIAWAARNNIVFVPGDDHPDLRLVSPIREPDTSQDDIPVMVYPPPQPPPAYTIPTPQLEAEAPQPARDTRSDVPPPRQLSQDELDTLITAAQNPSSTPPKLPPAKPDIDLTNHRDHPRTIEALDAWAPGLADLHTQRFQRINQGKKKLARAILPVLEPIIMPALSGAAALAVIGSAALAAWLDMRYSIPFLPAFTLISAGLLFLLILICREPDGDPTFNLESGDDFAVHGLCNGPMHQLINQPFTPPPAEPPTGTGWPQGVTEAAFAELYASLNDYTQTP